MPLSVNIALVIVGLVLLAAGSEFLLRGSASLARLVGTHGLVVGIIIIAYGSAAPELAVSSRAVLAQAAPLAMGNVIGGCIANLSLVLGIAAWLRPDQIDGRLVRRDIPALLGSVIVLIIMLLDGVLTRTEGIVLCSGAVVYTLLTLTLAVRDERTAGELQVMEKALDKGLVYGRNADSRKWARHWPVAILLLALSIGLLILGSRFMLDGARGVGKEWGMSDRVVGLTLVAVGTALPELITALLSVWRGYGNIAVGSLIGANVLNICMVLGVLAIVRPLSLGVRSNVWDIVGLAVITALAAFLVRSGRQIKRHEGMILVAGYIVFIVASAMS